jgi:hypothetical protein
MSVVQRTSLKNNRSLFEISCITELKVAYFYAMNFRINDFEKAGQARYKIVKDILRELKLIE